MTKIAFDGVPVAGTINFGLGQPSADLLPVSLLQTASDDFYSKAAGLELNYGELQGDERFRETLGSFLGRTYGVPAHANSLLVTSGNSQAMDFVCERFTHPGDTILVEEPSYFLAFQIFRDHGLNIVGIPTDADGMDIDALEETLTRTTAAMVYTIPSFHNPGGQTLSARRRDRLLELSRQHDFIIVADEVYQLLYADQLPPPALGCRTCEGKVLSLGSFSKILAPGLRLGWIQTSADLMAVLLDSGQLNSGGSFNHLASHVVRHAIDMGLQEAHIGFLRTAYQVRLEAMDAALGKHLSNIARWRKPGGGYFFWLELPEMADCAEMRKRAGDFEVGFQPGEYFSNEEKLKNCLRLSFAHYREDEIKTGVRRLADLIATELGS